MSVIKEIVNASREQFSRIYFDGFTAGYSSLPSSLGGSVLSTANK